MKPKRRRLYFVLFGMATLGLAAALVLSAFSDNLVFFYSPTDIATRDVETGRRLRLGGLVEEGSVSRDGGTVHFIVTDLAETVQVSFTGILPDLFREGQGVVTEGSLQADGRFLATNVLAKHDETYLPKEVAEALKASGQWRDSNDNAEASAQ
ncbi:MAG: cytochrome c maturation protein CcmE [Alphaproteobacteria bacterium]